MNILHINTYDQAGGAEQVAMDLTKNPYVNSCILVKKKYTDNPKVIEFDFNLPDKIFRILDKILWKINLKKRFKSVFFVDEQFNFTYSKIKRLKIYKEADIIHLHNIHGGYFDLDALVKICKDKPVVWTLHDMWCMTGGEGATFENTNYQLGIGKTPYNYSPPLNNPIIDRRQYFLNKKKRIYTKVGSKLTIVPVSYWLEKSFKSAYVYNQSLNIRTIHNGFDSTIFFNKRKRNWIKPRILFFNSNSPFKASSLFTDIIYKINIPFDLYLIGNKIDGFDEFKVVSYITCRKTLSELYNEVDILVFPSKAETFGLVPLEAMACGVCVVASNATAIPEVVDEEVGFLFNSGESADLLLKVNLALTALERTRELGEKASAKAAKAFNLDILFSKYTALYKSLKTV